MKGFYNRGKGITSVGWLVVQQRGLKGYKSQYREYQEYHGYERYQGYQNYKMNKVCKWYNIVGTQQ